MYMQKGKTHTSQRRKKMKKIEKFEELIRRCDEGENLKFTDFPEVNPTLYWAYRHSKRNGLRTIDFNDVVWGKDAQAIVKTLREEGYKSFTVSSTFSGLLEIVEAFGKEGCKMGGLTRVKQGFTEFDEETGKIVDAERPALRIRL